MCLRLLVLLGSLLHGSHALNSLATTPAADVVVYGSTVCGVTAAVAAAEAGATVTFVVNSSRLGGLTSGGLGGRDGGAGIIGKGSLADRLWANLGMNFEPHAAEASCQAVLDSAPAGRVTTVWHTGWLRSVATRPPAAAAGDTSQPRTIESITLQSGLTVRGSVFVDCSYEGDLLRLSGTEYAVGREARAQYGELLAGVDGQRHPNSNWSQTASMFAADVSPWVDATNTTLLPGIVGVQPYSDAQRGEADDWVMSMCFRMCLSNNASNSVPIGAPVGYTNLTMELLRRQMASKLVVTKNYTLDDQFLVRYLNAGRNKIDLNSGAFDKSPFSTDMPFLQHDWPLANASGRTRVFEQHKWWTQAVLYFVAHDAAVRRLQPAFSAVMRSWGLCKDEFPETEHWPPQLYVRESVRLLGPVVLTQKDVVGHGAKSGAGGLGRWNRSVGLSEWGVDIHGMRRVVVKVNGREWITNAGGHDTMRCKPSKGCGPDYPSATVQVPYDAITPKRNDTANLLVPVCISSSHIAFSTYRLEPQYAIFGQSAGVAAAMAAKSSGGVVHDVDVAALQAALAKAGQKLDVGSKPGPGRTGETAIAVGACGDHSKRTNASWTHSKSGQLLDENGKCLSVWADSYKSGARLVGATCHPIGHPSSDNQVWSVNAPPGSASAGCASLKIAVKPSFCLVVNNAGKVTLGTCGNISSELCLDGAPPALCHLGRVGVPGCVQSSKPLKTVKRDDSNAVHIELSGRDDLSADGSAALPFRTLGGLQRRQRRDRTLVGKDIKFGPGVHDLVAAGGLNLTSKGVTVSGDGLGKTVLSGGLRIAGSQFKETVVGGAKRWTATLAANTTYFRQLFVAGGGAANYSRRFTARTAVMLYDHVNMKDPEHSIVYFKGKVRPSYHNQADVFATLFHCWTATTHRIRSITASNRTLTLYQSPHKDIPRCEHASGKRFYIENAKEELKESQFYYDRQSRELTYLPTASELAGGLAQFVAHAPQLITPVTITASGVSIKDLSVKFAAADMSGFFEGDCDGQSATNLLTGAVQLACERGQPSDQGKGCENVLISRVEIAHTGGFGLLVGQPDHRPVPHKNAPTARVQNAMFSRLRVHDVGAGAVRLGTVLQAGGTVHTGSTLATSFANISLLDSELYDGGHVYLMGPGLQIGGCHGCEFSHNSIHDFLYTGITTGFGFKDDLIKDVTLAHNRIYNIARSTAEYGLSDLGCFYAWGGKQTGLLVDHNLCHNVSSYSYGGWGMYNDQTSQDIVWTNNIIYGTRDACYHDHEGFNITLRNNVLVGDSQGTDGVIRSAAPTPAPQSWHAAFNLQTTIIFSRKGAIFEHSPGKGAACSTFGGSTFDDNVYFRTPSAGNVFFPGDGTGPSHSRVNQTLAQWQKDGCGSKEGGQDKHSLIADPMFTDAAGEDFSLQPSSPALKLGFVPISGAYGPRPE